MEITMADESKQAKFRRIFVLQPSHDFSLLREFTEQIEFVTTGYETVEELENSIEEKLIAFIPTEDAVVVVGRVNAAFVFGAKLQEMFPSETIHVGVYKKDDLGDKTYNWIEINLGKDGYEK
jgi:hypothetical protein